MKEKYSLKSILVLAALLIFLPNHAQNARYPSRPVIINYDDSLIQANILTEKVESGNNINICYYWYIPDKINVTKGGYTGELLHGEYLVFDNTKNLLTQGIFFAGKKDGTWRSWYINGQLRSITNWNKGLMEGKSVYFNKSGTVYKSCEYKEGKMHGENIYFRNDSLIKDIYRNGELFKSGTATEPGIHSRHDTASQPFFKKMFNHTDTID